MISEHSTAYARGLISPAGIQIARVIAANAGALFAVSNPLARQLEEILSLPHGDFAVMPNLVDQSFLNASIPVRDAGKTNFLHVSLLDPKKRVEIIIRAFAQQFPQNSEVSLTIGGDGPTRDKLKLLAVELGVADRVNFLGHLSREQVRTTIAGSDAFVLASKYETFGVVLVEALAMGLPLIATKSGGPEDIVTPETGILIPTEDQDAMAAAMLQIHTSREKWPAEKLRADCKSRFGPEIINKRWIAHYEHLRTTHGIPK